MKIIVSMTGKPFESYQVDMDHVGEFHNPESGQWDAIPAVFTGRAIKHRGMLDTVSSNLYGIDVRKVTIV